MRLSPPVSGIAAALAMIVLPTALPAQTPAAAAGQSRPPGCRGIVLDTNPIILAREGAPPLEWPDYPVIEEVQPGSPAALAGMRFGDRIILQNGRDVVGNPPPPALAGDTVAFVVWRNGAEIPLTVVLGRWDPPDEAPGVTRMCRPVTRGPGGS